MSEYRYVFSPIVENLCKYRNKICIVEYYHGSLIFLGLDGKYYATKSGATNFPKIIATLIIPRWEKQYQTWKSIGYVKQIGD